MNPTNLVPEAVAKNLWGGPSSGLKAWDLITPNRASSNIGEFSILLPGEESLVLTKEIFLIRVIKDSVYDPFYLLWALSLQAVREQWRRIALMQTNREDCGERYTEVIIPKPKSRAWALGASRPFRQYFSTLAEVKNHFVEGVRKSGFEHVASVTTVTALSPEETEEAEATATE